MIIRSDRVVVWQLNSVLASQLTVRKCGVSVDTGLRAGCFSIKETHDVDVHGSEFSGLDLHVSEKTGGLVHSGDVGTANPVTAITRLQAGVLPAIDLSHSHDVLNAHVFAGSDLGDLRDVLAIDSKSLVQSFGEEVVGKSGLDFLDEFEHNGDPFSGEQRRPVIIGGVDPTVEEVMVSIGKTLSVEEKVIGCLLVKDLARGGAQRMPLDMEIGMLSILDPILPEGSLKTVSGPVPGILRLNNVELAIEAQSHHIVTNARSSTIHNHRVKAIETKHRKEITRLDQILININLLDGSLFELNTKSLFDEFDVSLLHVGGHMRADDGNVRVVSDSTEERFHGIKDGLNVLHNILTEGECLDTAISGISLSFRAIHLEGQSMSTMEVENLEVLDLSVSEKDDIFAELGSGIFCGHVNVECSVR